MPDPGPGEVVVQVEAIGVCGSDVHYYDNGRIGPYVVNHPMVIGHESAGTITAVGDGVDGGRIGERVAMEPGVPCRRCAQCRAGRYNLCPDVVFFATPPVDGSMVGYVACDADFAHRLPDSVDFVGGAMAEPVSVGVWACRKARVSPGNRVLVTGAGPIGLIAAQVARAFGASAVTISDVNAHRLGVARDLGFGTEDAAAPGADEFDVLIECSGAGAAVRAGMRRVVRAGTVVLVGMGADEVSLELPLIQNRELWLTGIFRYANTYPTALALIESGAVSIDALVTHRFPLAQAETALRAAREIPESIKSVVLPWAT